jgi:ligand-binding sensor domain-containing protein
LPAPSFYHLKRDFELFSAYYRLPTEDPYGFIWFGSGTGGGLYRYDGYDLICFNADPNRKAESIATDLIYSIYLAPDSNLYAGTILGFTRINLVNGSLKNFFIYYDSIPNPSAGVISAFFLDTLQKTLWIGTHYGLMSMNVATEKFTMLRPTPSIGQLIPDNIFQIYQDSVQSNVLWLLADEGIFKYDIASNQYTHVSIPGTASDNRITYGIKEPKSSIIWLATTEDFITSFHPTSNTWKNYPVKNPEGTPWIGLLPLNENECWISGDSTVGRLNLQNGLFESWRYRREYPDGLLYHGWYSNLLNDRHGRLWVTSFQGVQYAKEAFLPKSTAVEELKVRITGVDIVPVFEKKQKALMYRQAIELQRDQRDISFQFVLPNPLDKSKVKYQYKLAGFDNDWIQTDQRRVRYSKLSGGDYTFMVTGKEGDASDWLPMTQLKIHIDQRISELWWFWTILGLIALTFAIMLYRYMILRARKQERIKSDFENKLSEIQMQALRAQMNPHFLFNSLNSIKYYAISKSKDETASYLSKFALLVRTILNNSKSHTISLKDELEALQLYIEIEHLRLEGKFDYVVDIDKSIHVRQAQIPPMILQPYVENAIWHGLMHKDSKGLLLVQVKDLGNQIQCIIEDNGVGRERAAEIGKSRIGKEKSVGMQITGNRIEIINRIYGIDTQVHVIDLKDGENNPTGTRVVINIPLIRDEEE